MHFTRLCEEKNRDKYENICYIECEAPFYSRINIRIVWVSYNLENKYVRCSRLSENLLIKNTVNE